MVSCNFVPDLLFSLITKLLKAYNPLYLLTITAWDSSVTLIGWPRVRVYCYVKVFTTSCNVEEIVNKRNVSDHSYTIG